MKSGPDSAKGHRKSAGPRAEAMQYADVNGIRIAYGVRGAGPPLVLIMGYRLSSLAWPRDFVEALAKRFTVILFDNRGTGTSDKPTSGYELSNMARDVHGLLAHLGIPRANVLGYSMGGAIAQEFARQFPDQVLALVLCATTCGGPRATYASPSVIRVMRELDGLKPEEIARRIWRVTYSPGYLENHKQSAEDQMQREIAAPTPLYAADLQFQAFAEFDVSRALPHVDAPTLVMTGDLDKLVPPQNSRLIAALIPGANLIVIPGCGHRMMWEATDECVGFVAEFLAGVSEGRRSDLDLSVPRDAHDAMENFLNLLTPAINLVADVPWMLAGAAVDTMTITRQSIYFAGKAQFGDGKPIVLIPELSSHLPFLMLANWLRALGYRPATTSPSMNAGEPSVSEVLRTVTQRTGRKAVLVTGASGVRRTSAMAEAHKEEVSDIVVLNASRHAEMPAGIRSHFISSGWSLFLAMTMLPQVLRGIQIELIEISEAS